MELVCLNLSEITLLEAENIRIRESSEVLKESLFARFKNFELNDYPYLGLQV